MPHPPRIRSLLEQLPAWTSALAAAGQGDGWVAGAALALAIVHNLAYDSTVPGADLRPRPLPDRRAGAARLPLAEHPARDRPLGDIDHRGWRHSVTAPDGNRDVTIMTLPAVLLIAALTVNTFAYAVPPC